MQNLETKFPATSPNIEYLGQFHLLDQDQVVEEHYETECCYNSGDYEFQEHCQPNQEEQTKQDFREFCQSLLRFKLNKQSNVLEIFIGQLALLLLREVFQHRFLKYQLRNNQVYNRIYKKFDLQEKTYIFIKLFTLFALFYLFPLQTSILLMYFWSNHRFASYQSQIQSLNILTRQLNQSFLELKINMLQNLSTDNKSQRLTNHLFLQLLNEIKKEFQIATNNSQAILDQLQAAIFQIIKHIRAKEIQVKFISSSIFSSKIIHLQACKINKSLKYSMNLLRQFSEKIKVIHEEFYQLNKIKFQPNPVFYFSIIAQKIKSYSSNTQLNERQLQSYKSKLKILDKEIAFRKLYSYNKRIISEQKPSNQQRSQEQTASYFIQEKNPQKASICFQNGNIEFYESGDFSLIKQKLQNILLQKDRIQKKQKQEAKKQKDRLEETLIINSRQLKKQRISFGIGLIPPKRNLQAFYSD